MAPMPSSSQAGGRARGMTKGCSIGTVPRLLLFGMRAMADLHDFQNAGAPGIDSGHYPFSVSTFTNAPEHRRARIPLPSSL